MAKKAEAEEPQVPVGPGKGHATPSRRDAQAANRRPLVPSDRKAAAKESRSRTSEDRARARAGFAAGEERYLPQRDRGVQRRFVRDSVDARWGIGELLLPVFFVLFIGSISGSAVFQVVCFAAIYGCIVIAVVDGLLLARRIRRRLAERIGGPEKLERGLGYYTVMRAIYPRFLRTPRPQVKRGAPPR